MLPVRMIPANSLPLWRRVIVVALIALLSPIPAVLAFWAVASGDGIVDTWVDPSSGVVFTLDELDAFSDDIDGDGLSNAQELALGTDPFLADTDGDWLSDAVDPAPLDSSNYSPYNGRNWSGSDALGDADNDGIANYWDTDPYGSTNSPYNGSPNIPYNGNGDTDYDGIPDLSDPAPLDSSNYSPNNGRSWIGSDALGDADNDGTANYWDADPYGLYLSTNTSPYNGIAWGADAMGDADNDGIANYNDSDPYPRDLDWDGLADSVDPAQYDPSNFSTINSRAWPGVSALEDLDLDGITNFYDPEPEGQIPREPYASLPSASASPLIILNDGYDELGEAPAEGVTPRRDLDDESLAIKAGPRAGKMAISRLTEMSISLPAEYVEAGGTVTFNQVGAGFIRLHAVRMVDGEGVEDREISMGVPYLPPNEGTWVHLVESVRGGGVKLTCHFPWMLYGEITGEHPSGVMSSNVEVDLPLVQVEVVVRKKTEATAPETGLLVKKGDVITFDVNGLAPAGEFPLPSESVKWKIRQLKHDGTTTEWADVQGQGAELDFTTSQGGVFEAKAVITPPGGQPSNFPLTRRKNAPHADNGGGEVQDIHKAGAVDYFGVSDQQWQINLREKALADLGSTKFATLAVFIAPWFPGREYKRTNKCNIFVYDKCYEAGVDVPLTRERWGKLPLLITEPPLAIDWWNDNSGRKDNFKETIQSVEIPGWTRLPNEAMPQPGLVVARPILGGVAVRYDSHCGIFDYDGSWISAGPSKVNKYCHLKVSAYQPVGIRKYNGGN